MTAGGRLRRRIAECLAHPRASLLAPTRSAIKRAYRRLARMFHPDLHPAASDEERRELESRFAKVTEAYRTLVA